MRFGACTPFLGVRGVERELKPYSLSLTATLKKKDLSLYIVLFFSYSQCRPRFLDSILAEDMSRCRMSVYRYDDSTMYVTFWR
jgi:hypothetical protein